MDTGMTELVLGGEGLIGASLVSALRCAGHRVISLDLRSGYDLRFADDASFVACDRVWFLAWDTGGAKYIGDTRAQHGIYVNNCQLSSKVFDILARVNKPFLFVTSQLAGQPNAYGLTKLLAEHWAARLGGKVARLWNVYGWERPDVKSHVVPDLVLSGLIKGRVCCRTNGEERRRFLYKDDCASALIRLFDGPRATADIGGSDWLTVRDVAEEIGRQLGVGVDLGQSESIEVMVIPEDRLPDWQPTVTLSAGIARVIADAREYLMHANAATTDGVSPEIFAAAPWGDIRRGALKNSVS